MKWLIAAIAAAALAGAFMEPKEPKGPDCTTDSECMALCPEGSQDLRPDNPDYCDGGPQQ